MRALSVLTVGWCREMSVWCVGQCGILQKGSLMLLQSVAEQRQLVGKPRCCHTDAQTVVVWLLMLMLLLLKRLL